MNIAGKKIVFWFDETSPRACCFNYKNYTDVCGFSGTCAVTLELARKLAESKNTVYISHPDYGLKNTFRPGNSEFNGYLNYTYVTPDEDLLKDCDVFVFSFGFFCKDSHDILSKLKEGTIVCAFSHMYWSHSAIFDIHNYCKSKKLNFYYIVNSKTSKKHFISNPSEVKYIHVNNSISKPLFYEEINKHKNLERKNQIIFTSSLQRGGEMAGLIASHLGKNYVNFSYLPGPHGSGSVGKKELIKNLCESDYFVYTASDMEGNFPTDTYCNAVHEALACGVIVLTWDISCFKDVYGDNIVILDFPILDFPFDPKALGVGLHTIKKLIDPFEYLKFAEKIKEIDINTSLKNTIRDKGKKWALSNTYDIEYKNFLRIFEN